jgi:two-component system chemotaxis response regulator CheB
MKDTTRVLVVDDSPTVREILVGMLQSESGLEVVGQAQDGEEAIQMAANLHPDVITMDIRMPRTNGLEATRRIMSATPTPIVVVTTSVYDEDMDVAFNAVAAGALTVVEKPKGLAPGDYEAVREQLVTTIKLMAEVPVVTLWLDRRPPTPVRSPEAAIELIALATSTGGPGVLRQILGGLPDDVSVPIVIVQHITSGFMQGFAHWLDSATPLHVAIASDNEAIVPGRILIAPDDTHLTVGHGGIIRLDRSPPINGLRPSATRLFDSVAEVYGSAAVGIVLTGMGEDGADGLENLRLAGGSVIAQSEESCVVFGMPKAAIERGIVNQILMPDEIASVLQHLDGRYKSKESIDVGRL